MTSGHEQQYTAPPELELNLELEGEQASVPETEAAIERRRAVRPTRPKLPGFKGYIRRLTDSLINRLGSGWQSWTILTVTISGTIILLWWSLAFRTHHLDQNFDLIADLTERRNTFSKLLTKWSHEDLNQLRTRVSNAESRVFPDYEKLASWINSQAYAAEQLNLTMRYSMAAPQSSEIAQVAEIPIEIQITTKQAIQKQSYLRMLEFIKSIVDDQWHIEIVSAVMHGQGSNVNSLSSTFRIWVRDLQSPSATPGTQPDAEFTQ